MLFSTGAPTDIYGHDEKSSRGFLLFPISPAGMLAGLRRRFISHTAFSMMPHWTQDDDASILTAGRSMISAAYHEATHRARLQYFPNSFTTKFQIFPFFICSLVPPKEHHRAYSPLYVAHPRLYNAKQHYFVFIYLLFRFDLRTPYSSKVYMPSIEAVWCFEDDMFPRRVIYGLKMTPT